MDQIIDKLKSTNKYFWFIPKGKKMSLIAQSTSKKQAKNIFSEKLSKKKDGNKADAILIASFFYETYQLED